MTRKDIQDKKIYSYNILRIFWNLLLAEKNAHHYCNVRAFYLIDICYLNEARYNLGSGTFYLTFVLAFI